MNKVLISLGSKIKPNKIDALLIELTFIFAIRIYRFSCKLFVEIRVIRI